MVTQTRTEIPELAQMIVRHQETCDGYEYFYDLEEIGYETKVCNDVDRRVKPTGYAWESMTSQQPQLTMTSTSKVWDKTGSKFMWCAGRGMVKLASTVRRYDRMQVLHGSVSDPRWETEMRLKIKDLSVNLGASLAEYKQTASMFGNYAGTVHDVYKFLRKRKKWKKLTFCDAADTELMVSFGLNPLMQDTYDSVVALQRALTRPIVRRFYLKKANSDSAIEVLDDTAGNILWNDKVELRVVVYVEFKPEGPSTFTVGNPAELLWELTPFSFVVDWGIPIGDWLSSLDALKDVKKLNGCVTRKRTYEHTDWTVPVDDVSNKHELISTGKLKYESHERTLLSTIPIPPLPRYEPSDSLHSVMHAVSLLKNMSKGCQKGRSKN